MYKLVISDDEGKTTVVPLVRDEISIGRKEGNTIRLTERNVSRKHAKLLKANGAFVVEDLNSYNGVKVNGRRIDGRVNLKSGDQLGIGDYVLALQSDAVADAPTAAVAGAGEVSDAATAMIESPAEPRPPARLVMLTPPAPGAEFALSRERQRIGRAEDLPIWVNHRSISREHAEIAREGGDFRVIDLGSANGVRVNGREIEEASLTPGDVLELGQVRFRYVGEGESYVFDSDATVQMEPVNLSTGMSKAPIVAAVAIIGVAVVVAGVLAIGTGGDDDGPTATPINETSAVGEANVDGLISECRSALDRWAPAEAVAAAQTALEVAPGHAEAAACKDVAERMRAEEPTFERGQAFLAQNEFEDAAMEFDNLPAESRYRQHPEVERANNAVVRAWLRLAEEALDAGDVEEARTHAEMVQNRVGVSESSLEEAQSIIERADAGGTEVAMVRDPVTPPPEQHHPRMNTNSMVRMTQQQETNPPPTMTAPTTMGNPLIDCTSEANYNACIVRNLRHPGSPREYEALINAYRETGQRNRACDLMRQVISRYPTSPAARRFNQFVQRNCN